MLRCAFHTSTVAAFAGPMKASESAIASNSLQRMKIQLAPCRKTQPTGQHIIMMPTQELHKTVSAERLGPLMLLLTYVKRNATPEYVAVLADTGNAVPKIMQHGPLPRKNTNASVLNAQYLIAL